MRFVLTPEPPAVDAAHDFAIDGPKGPIPVRIYRPVGAQRSDAGGAALPVTLYFHGGGWVLGDLETHDFVCRSFAARSGAAVVAVDYRLAPEHKFPAAAEDAVAAWRWLAGGRAAGLGLDGRRVAVAGDSAGGNLAAVVALTARDAEQPLAGQLLVYPATDMTTERASMREFATGHLLERAGMNWFYDHYLPTAADARDWRASPLLAARHDGLAAALVMTAGCDPLRDEGKAYADKLRAAGTPVEYRCFDGLIHGFLAMGKVVRASDEALALAAAFLRRVLAAG
jgi:acetyl esterase